MLASGKSLSAMADMAQDRLGRAPETPKWILWILALTPIGRVSMDKL
jgi:hypothetical protein